MELIDSQSTILSSIESYFSNQYKNIRKNIALCSYSILRTEKVNTAEIARQMGEVNGLAFKANDMRIYRFLKSKEFQIDDKMWRGYVNLFFSLLQENGVKKNSRIHVNIDFTSDRDDFLILCASIYFKGQSIPIYFSMRNYPKRAGMHDQKKMEQAFFKALKHILPNDYEYLIVADRGFGNERVIRILEELNFKYVLRLNENLNIEGKNGKFNLKDLPKKNKKLHNIEVISWSLKASIVKRVKNDEYWLLSTNLAKKELDKAGGIYERRFSIEKMFKNSKSGGFDIENLLIEKYDRFKKLLFLSCIAYTIMIFTGLFIDENEHPIKKNFFLHLTVLSAFSR